MSRIKKKIFLTLTLLLLACVLFSQDIVLKNGKYYQGKTLYTGQYTEFYPDGKIMAERNLTGGVANGITMIYYENGIKKEQQSYSNGLKDGLWITWNEKGIKTGEANYKNDLKEGPWNIWDDNGTLRYKMFYAHGEKTGTWKLLFH